MKKKYKNKLDLGLLSDLELLDNIYNSQDCNQEAIGELYARYYQAAYYYLISMYNGDRERASTMYNDTFINVINALETKFLETIKGNDDYKPYLFGALKKNFNREYWKKMNRSEDIDIEDIFDYTHTLYEQGDNIEDSIIKRESTENIFEWLKGILSETQYSFLELKLDGLDYETIGERLGISSGAVRGRLARIRDTIRKNKSIITQN